MYVSREQANYPVWLSMYKEAYVDLALGVGGPLHAQRDRVAFAGNSRNPGIPSSIEEMQRLHRNEGLAGIGLLRVLRGEETRAEDHDVETDQDTGAQQGEAMATEAPPHQLPIGRDSDPFLDDCRGNRCVQLHGYKPIRMRGSIIASAMSDNKVPTMVRNE